MLHIPGDLVRRAGSTIAGAVPRLRLGSVHGEIFDVDEYSILQKAREKQSLSVKGTPSKDAQTTSALSVKSGFIMKKNEQGVWHKVFVCVVPHFFMYYFDSDTGDVPKGIIDLHLYTKMTFDTPTVLKMATDTLADGSSSPLRTFYFSDDDPNVLSDWVTCFHRERYQVVKDERDAYQQLQDQFSGEMDSATRHLESSAQDKERMQIEIAQARQESLNALRALQGVLVDFGITETEMTSLTDAPKAGAALVAALADLKREHDKEKREMEAQTRQQQESLKARIEELEIALAEERNARKQLESQFAAGMKEAESRTREVQSQVDEALLNMQLAVASKVSAETKLSTLSEQKKLLVKEVKSLRKKLEEASEAEQQLKSEKEALSATLGSLQGQVKRLQEEVAHAAHNRSSGIAATSHEHAAASSAEGPPAGAAGSASHLGSDAQVTSTSTWSTVGKDYDLLSGMLEAAASLTDGAVSAVASAVISDASPSAAAAATHVVSSGGAHQLTAPKDKIPPPTGGRSGEHEEVLHGREEDEDGTGGDTSHGDSFSMSASELKELGWLCAEQRELVAGRAAERTAAATDKSSATPFTAASPPSAGSMLASALLPSFGSVGGSGDKPERRGSSLGMLGSIFQVGDKVSSSPALDLVGDDASDSPGYSSHSSLHPIHGGAEGTPVSTAIFTTPVGAATGPSKLADAATAAAGPNSITSFFGSPLPPDDGSESADRVPKAMRLHCLRCQGTVEGPKYSTCKCDVPALTPEDLASGGPSGRRGSLLGMFSLGSSVAGGIAGGLRRNSTAIAQSLSQSLTGSGSSSSSGSTSTEAHEASVSPRGNSSASHETVLL